MVRGEVGRAQHRVVKYVLSHPEDAIHMSITQLAEASGSSEATIVRLVQDLGFKGFNDFKISLSRSMSVSDQVLERDLDASATVAEILQNVFGMSQTSLSETWEALDPRDVEAAIAILSRAERIEFVGVGGSGAVAFDAYHKFLRLGVPVSAPIDPHNAAQVAATLGSGAVVVVISHSGRTRDVLEVARLAKESDAQVIAITRFGRSPLQRLADVTLQTLSSETSYRSEAIASRISQLVIIDALLVGVFLRNQPTSGQHLLRSRSALQEKRS